MISSKAIHKVLNTILSKELLRTLHNINVALFIVCFLILSMGYGYVIQNTPNKPILTNKQLTQEEQSPAKLLETNNQPPEMVKCNLTECSKSIDPNQEIFITCKNSTNPNTKCDGIVFINVTVKTACEYCVTIKRAD